MTFACRHYEIFSCLVVPNLLKIFIRSIKDSEGMLLAEQSFEIWEIIWITNILSDHRCEIDIIKQCLVIPFHKCL